MELCWVFDGKTSFSGGIVIIFLEENHRASFMLVFAIVCLESRVFFSIIFTPTQVMKQS